MLSYVKEDAAMQKLFDFYFLLAAVEKLERVVNTVRLKRITAAWCNAAKDSKRAREYFKVSF